MLSREWLHLLHFDGWGWFGETNSRHAPDPVDKFALSTSSAKVDAAFLDPYFRESLEDLQLTCGLGVAEILSDFGFLILKPDALVRHKIREALSWLDANGWVVTYASVLQFTREKVRGVWGYQWKTADRRRREVLDLIMLSERSVALLVRPRARSMWASSQLTKAKGPFDVAIASPGQMRFDLGSLNRQLNLVHTSDEPVDMIREIGACFDSVERRRLYAAAMAGDKVSTSVLERIVELEDLVRSIDLDLRTTTRSISDRIDPQYGDDSATLLMSLNSIARGESRDWQSVIRLACATNTTINPWEIVSLMTWLLPPSRGEKVDGPLTEAVSNES